MVQPNRSVDQQPRAHSLTCSVLALRPRILSALIRLYTSTCNAPNVVGVGACNLAQDLDIYSKAPQRGTVPSPGTKAINANGGV